MCGSYGLDNDVGVMDASIREMSIQALRKARRRISKLTSTLEELKRRIEEVSSHEAFSVVQAIAGHNACANAKIPLPDCILHKGHCEVKYARSDRISWEWTSASYLTTAGDDQNTVDMLVQMPLDLFDAGDHADYKYFIKRAYYLACIATALHQHDHNPYKLQYMNQDDNILQPILMVYLNEDLPNQIIRIIPTVEIQWLQDRMTFPSQDFLKSQMFCHLETYGSLITRDIYIATLKSDCCIEARMGDLQFHSEEEKVLQQAVMMGHLWLHRRNLGTSISAGGFGTWEWARLIVLFTQISLSAREPLIRPGLGALQIFKAFLAQLVKLELQHDLHSTERAALRDLDPIGPTFFDHERGYNVLYKMTASSYETLRLEAQSTLDMFNDPACSTMTCFSTVARLPVITYDITLEIPTEDFRRSTNPKSDQLTEHSSVYDRLYHLLSTALQDRVKLINIQPAMTHPWPITDKYNVLNRNHTIQVGLSLHPKNGHRIIDKGPAVAENVAAEKYRKFWGDKSELRRFGNGEILESLVWSTNISDGHVISQIVKHIILKHIGQQTAARMRAFGPSIGGDLHLAGTKCIEHDLAAFKELEKQALDLERDIITLNGQSLGVKAVMTIDDRLRRCSVEVPVFELPKSQMSPVKLCIHLETSRNWPQNLMAIQMTKVALLLELGRSLQQKKPDHKYCVGFSDWTSSVSSTVFLDIINATGASFRAYIYHEVEHKLLESRLFGERASSYGEERSMSALVTYRRAFVECPKHSSSMKLLDSRLPQLTNSIRLLKKWRDSHLMSWHLSDELIELLTTHVFLHPGDSGLPGSAMVGLLRVLSLISTWDWRHEPLIINIGGNLTHDLVKIIRSRFLAHRKVDPSMTRVAIYVASDLEGDGSIWTHMCPQPIVAGLLTSFAGADMALVRSKGVQAGLGYLFTPDFTTFDAVIHLRSTSGHGAIYPSGSRSIYKNLEPVYNAGQNKDSDIMSLRESLIMELDALYKGLVSFFHDQQRLDVIGCIFSPDVPAFPWKANTWCSVVPRRSSPKRTAMIGVNRHAVLSDIARLGGSLIRKVCVRYRDK